MKENKDKPGPWHLLVYIDRPSKEQPMRHIMDLRSAGQRLTKMYII